MSSRIHLLPESCLIRTGDVDHADWNYGRLISPIQRRRFLLIDELLAGRKFETILEIGYGSGIFMPHLAGFASKLIGVDVHEHGHDVQCTLRDLGIDAELITASADNLPFADGSVDCIVAVSSLSFIVNIDAACGEMARVLTFDGRVLAVLPCTSPFLDLALRLFTGESAAADYEDRRENVIPAIKRDFAIRRVRTFPASWSPLRIYKAIELVTLKQRSNS